MGVINEAEGIFETNICEVYIVVCKLEAFKSNNDCLELAGHVTGWATTFLCRVQSVECRWCVSINVVMRVVGILVY